LIARIWHGKTPIEKAGAYSKFLNARAISDYRSTPGNIAVHILRRDEGDTAHFYTFTLWESVDAIRRFAGSAIDLAKYYPEDQDFLVEFEPRVTHWEVVGSASS
jgi:heme-degrading monooxygenase HmoA